jgi:hypothetical protein
MVRGFLRFFKLEHANKTSADLRPGGRDRASYVIVEALHKAAFLRIVSGRSAAWLARLVRDQEVEGSNPFAPTTHPKTNQVENPQKHELDGTHSKRADRGDEGKG